MIYVGIDPGFSGAISALDSQGELICLRDMPVITDGRKKHYNVTAMVDILRELSLEGKVHAMLERSQAMPGQGVTSMLKIGIGYGIWLGIFAGLGIPFSTVRPHEWVKTVLAGLPGKGKERSILWVSQNFPEADLTPGRRTKPMDGRADAICLAKYAQATVV
jgi:hypothetical protein